MAFAKWIVCLLKKMLSTVCLTKNAGGVQSIAAAAVGFFNLQQQHLAPATLRDGSKMPGINSVCRDQVNHECWCCPLLLQQRWGLGWGTAGAACCTRSYLGGECCKANERCNYERLLQLGCLLHLQFTSCEELPGLAVSLCFCLVPRLFASG